MWYIQYDPALRDNGLVGKKEPLGFLMKKEAQEYINTVLSKNKEYFYPVEKKEGIVCFLTEEDVVKLIKKRKVEKAK